MLSLQDRRKWFTTKMTKVELFLQPFSIRFCVSCKQSASHLKNPYGRLLFWLFQVLTITTNPLSSLMLISPRMLELFFLPVVWLVSIPLC